MLKQQLGKGVHMWIKQIVCVISFLFVTGCSLLNSFAGKSVEKNQYRDRSVLEMINEIPTVVEKPVSRVALESALQVAAKLSGPRVVPIFRRDARVVFPEHRIFELRKDGPLSLLGLQNGDIIVGVNDRVLVQPEAFLGLYPSAVLQDGKSDLVLRRGEQLLELQVTITE
jgi:S1-C subfamily serine protease